LAANAVWSFTTVAAPPTVTGQSPAAGGTGIPTSTTVTATFSQALDATTVTTATFELRMAGTLVPSTVSYNAATLTATLTPTAALATSTVYTVTVHGGTTDPRIKNSSGAALAADVVWSFTTAAPASGASCPCSIWSAAAAPAAPQQFDASAVELGVRFQSDRAGYITALRFFKGAGNNGTHVGSLWSASGTLLGSVTFAN